MKNPQDLPADSEPLRELPEDYVLASYLAGEDDAAAKALVKTWVGGDVRRQKALERLRDGWDGAAREPVQGDLPGFLQTLWRQIEKEEKIATPEGREDSAKYGVAIRPGKGRTLRRWGWSAGIVSAGILAVVLGRIDQPVDAEITRTYTTHPGQQATFTLIDGSRITLAPQSTLRLTRFGRRFRTVELDGEAYFEVPHTPDAPFLVQSGLVTTRVLGTAF